MIIKPDADATQALGRLGRSRDWEVLEPWLAACREANVQRSLDTAEATSRQAQGALMVIDGLIELTRSVAAHATGR